MSEKVIYEVNLSVDAAVFEDYNGWLNKHVEEVLELPGFVRAKRLLPWAETKENTGDESEDKQIKLTMHYYLSDRESLESYLANHAATMRAEGLQRFPDRFSATRRIFDIAETV